MKFASAVLLAKREAFVACETCAEAERALLRSGKATEAARIAALFELIEARLVEDDPGFTEDDPGPTGDQPGSKSNESELTQ